MSPCPRCQQQPEVERCGPWPKSYGPAPWYVGCYQGGDDEHCVAVNGDTIEEALANWEREVRDHKAKQ